MDNRIKEKREHIQWLLPSSKDSTPESVAAALIFSCRLLIISCSSELPLLAYKQIKKKKSLLVGLTCHEVPLPAFY